MTTRRQHYVWQHYLRGWLNNTGKLFCLRSGKIFYTRPSNIMVERDFCKVPIISYIDALFLESAFISRTSRNLQPIHRNLLESLMKIGEVHAIVQKNKAASTEEKELLESLVVQTGETLHQGIEGDAVPILDQLRCKKLDFLRTDRTAISFFHYVAHQYMRTKKIHEFIGAELKNNPLGYDFSHLTNFVCYFSATNIGSTLYVDRRNLKFNFLENFTKFGFITGDQPIVNLLENFGVEPKEVILYYPLSSRLALLISPKKYTPTSIRITDESVEYFNSCIAWNSRDSIVSQSRSDLETACDKRPTSYPSFHDHFDVLREL